MLFARKRLLRVSRARTEPSLSDIVPQRQDLQQVEIHGHGFVSNLFWQPLNNARNYMAEAKSFGKKNGWDIVAIRRGTRIQAGFVDSGSRNLKGMYSLAASLASQLGDSWLGAFRLQDGRYAVVAVHEMLICPGLDVLCDAEKARELLTNAVSLYSFEDESIFAPPELEFASQERDIYQLLAPKALRKDNRLKQLTFGMTRRQLILTAVVAVSFLAAGIGYLQWSAHKDAVRQQAIAQARASEAKRLLELNARARKKLELAALAHPWATQSTAAELVTACGKAVDRLPLSIAGWVFQHADCANSELKVEYDRKLDGTVLGFGQTAFRQLGATPVFQGGDVAALKISVPVAVGGDDSIEDADSAMGEFLSHFQRLGILPTVEERAVKIEMPAPPAGQPPLQAPDATWRQFHFSFDDRMPPIRHFSSTQGDGDGWSSLKNIPGLRIESIKTTLEADGPTLTWHIEGNIYAKK